MARADSKGIFFDSAHLGDPTYDYVCWLDVMGTANQMLRSLPIAANFVFKLHLAVLESSGEVGGPSHGVLLYPVMDGVYITSPRRKPLQLLLSQALCRLALTFLNEDTCFHQFLVRGAIAYGPVYHGARVDPRASRVLAGHARVRDSILMGVPMAQAYQTERDAPPFGVAVHSSARSFAPSGDSPFPFVWLDWHRRSRPCVDAKSLLGKLQAYFDWQSEHCIMTGYEPERIERHRNLAREFLTSGANDVTSDEPHDAPGNETTTFQGDEVLNENGAGCPPDESTSIDSAARPADPVV